MRQQSIDLFMWGYQPYFRWSLGYLMEQVLEKLGTTSKVDALVVGAMRPGAHGHPVCVEPEKGDWPLSLFSGLLESVERIYKDHPAHQIFYGDENSMREKPERIRRNAVTSAVRAALKPFDVDNAVRSFCGEARLVDSYYVVPVIQLPEALFEQFPPLAEYRLSEGNMGYPSLIHAAVAKVLDECCEELGRDDPGRDVTQRGRNAAEIALQSARSFMYTPGARISRRYAFADLFETFNLISSLFYEGAEGLGHIVLTDQAADRVDYVLRFKEPVVFADHRWARKILQMATPEVAAVADAENIYGLGRVKAGEQSSAEVFTVHFLDHYTWDLRSSDQVLIRCRYGVPKLPQEAIDKDLFLENFRRMFPASTVAERGRMWEVLCAAAREKHGSMIVACGDAESEAQRLIRQGTPIEPVALTVELFQRVSGIDGTILVDPHGICHAVGVILDGPANDECKPSRGSRYNSGVRYVRSSKMPRLALVLSEDQTIDIVPRLRPCVSRGEFERYIAALERSTLDDCHKPRNWLDSHRFYANELQCERINSALERLAALPRDVGEIFLSLSPFRPHPDMDDSYLTD